MDLTTAQFVTSLMPNLSADQLAALPTWIAAASQTVQDYCNRLIGYREGIEELAAAEPSGAILLGERPVRRVRRVACARQVALTVRNLSGTTQAARAEIVPAEPGGLVGVQLDLATRSLGVASTASIAFASLATGTINELAGRINATGGGWAAAAGPDFGNWAATELLAGDSRNARQAEATFELFGDEHDFEVDRESGLLQLRGTDLGGLWGDRFGRGMDDEIGGGGQALRITYDAGLNPIPANLQMAVAEVVKFGIERFETSSVLQSERTDVWAWTAREFGEVIGAMPDAVRQVISRYRNEV